MICEKDRNTCFYYSFQQEIHELYCTFILLTNYYPRRIKSIIQNTLHSIKKSGKKIMLSTSSLERIFSIRPSGIVDLLKIRSILFNYTSTELVLKQFCISLITKLYQNHESKLSCQTISSFFISLFILDCSPSSNLMLSLNLRVTIV